MHLAGADGRCLIAGDPADSAVVMLVCMSVLLCVAPASCTKHPAENLTMGTLGCIDMLDHLGNFAG